MTSDRQYRWLNHGIIAFVCIFLLALVVGAVLAKVLQYNKVHIHDWDTGIYFNVAWNIFQGDGFYSDVLRRNHLGEHFSPVTALFAPIFLISSSPVWILAVQGLAVGATYVVLYFIAIKILRDATIPHARLVGLILPLAAYLYRPLTSALMFEFHPSTLATSLLAGAVLALLHRRNMVLWMLVALLLLTKENAALAILGLAIYAGLVQGRRRLFLALFGTAAVSATLIFGVIMPFFQSDEWRHYNRLGLLSHWQEKTDYLFFLLKGVAFLPLAAWRCSASVIPLVALNLSVSYEPQFAMNHHYDDLASVFLLIAAMHGFAVIVQLVLSHLSGWRLRAALSYFVLVSVALAYAEARSPHPKLEIDWQTKHGQLLHEALAPYRNLPETIGMAATQPLGPYISARQRYIPLNSKRLHLLNALKPGDLILTSAVRGSQEFAGIFAQPEMSGWFQNVHASPTLSVHKVVVSPKFPMPGRTE